MSDAGDRLAMKTRAGVCAHATYAGSVTGVPGGSDISQAIRGVGSMAIPREFTPLAFTVSGNTSSRRRNGRRFAEPTTTPPLDEKTGFGPPSGGGAGVSPW